MEGLHNYTDDQVMPFTVLLELGAAYEREHPGTWTEWWRSRAQ